jgi:2-C-methyl-D-erythritol 2,4-cyclodiphosphate synthase
VTIVLERPKLKFYIPSIKKSVSKGLKISPGQVNIKATTSEKMGFVGREEGIVCYTTVLIEKI